MSPERLQKIEETFHRAAALAGAERAALLDAECAGDPELRREVESLLEFEETGGDILDSTPSELAAAMLSPVTESTIVGRDIKQYRVDRLIGTGGMGRVYLARDTKLERNVAIKILGGDLASDSARLGRFFREAKSASALNHPNILTVHEIGDADGAHYIVTEFIAGRTLMRYVNETRPSVDEIIRIAVQIASALAAAHAGGIIHRDVKPENVMVRDDGLVKVLDFGIAKLDASSTGSTEAPTIRQTSSTLPGMIIGTPQYMSPEQARAEFIDNRTDIFSFGAVLYEMITGRPAFTGRTNADILGSVLKDEPPAPVFPNGAEPPPEIALIIMKALRKDRAERYQSLREVIADLEAARRVPTLGDVESDTPTVTLGAAAPTAPTGQMSGGRSAALVFGGAAVALVLFAAAALGFWLLRPAAPSPRAAAERQQRPAEVISWASTPGEFYSTGAFSPDGNLIAFSSTRGNNGRQLWIKQAGAGEAVQVTRDEFANEQPVWAPGGQELAYFSTRGNQVGVWRIPLLGGAPKLIAPLDDGSALLRGWSKSDVVYIELDGELEAMSVADGQTRQVTNLRVNGIVANSISVADDEKRIAFVRNEGDKTGIWTAAADGSDPRRLVDVASETRNTAWSADGRRIFYSALIDRTFQAFVVDATAGGEPTQLTFGESDAYVADFSASGDRLLLGAAKEESDIWKVTVKDGAESVVAAGIDAELWAEVAPDSRAIAFQSVRNLSQGNNLKLGRLLVKKIDGSLEPREISASGSSPTWSPDGRVIAFAEISGRTHQLKSVDVESGRKTSLVDDILPGSYGILPYNRVQLSDFSWSPDGRKLAYVARPGGGPANVWTVDADGAGNRVQVTSNEDPKASVYCPLWSPDGRSIAFTSRGSGGRMSKFQLAVVDVATREVREVTQSEWFLRLLGWDAATPGAVFVMTAETSGALSQSGDARVVRFDLAGASKDLQTLRGAYLSNIRISPDRRSVAFVANRDGRDNVYVGTLAGGEPRRLTTNNDGRLYFSSLAWAPDGSFVVFGKQSRYSVLSILAQSN